MTFPTQKRLEAAFPGKGRELRELLDGRRDPLEYTGTADWVRQCYNRPSLIELKMHAANQILESHGTEAIFGENNIKWPSMEYVNTGDAYATTLIYDYTRSRFLIMCWGEWVEREERQGRSFE